MGVAYAQQDIFQQSFTPYVQFPNLPWGSGAGAVNNNFWFNTLQAEQGVCIWVTNLNPISAHSFSLTVSSTPDAGIPGFTGFTGRWTSTLNSAGVAFPFTVSANSTTTFFYNTRSSAYVAMQFSGSAGAGGAPDTATITAVLTTAANCSAIVIGNTVIGPTPNGSAISASNQQPVIVGGGSATGGAGYLQNARTAMLDTTTQGWMVGIVYDANEQSAPRGAALNYGTTISSGAATFLHVMPWGQQSDAGLGSGAGDVTSPFRNSRPYGTAVGPIWEWASTSYQSGGSTPLATYNSRTDQVNPAAGALLLAINTTSVSNNGITPYRITVSCEAACDFLIRRVTDAGNTCAAGTIVKTFDPSLGAAINYAAVTAGCVANPTSTQVLFHIWLAAGGTWQQNMMGYWWRNVAPVGSGFSVEEGTAVAAGTVSTTFEFMTRSGN